jgi:uncharacterized protein YfdQ (DUF2303 family)
VNDYAEQPEAKVVADLARAAAAVQEVPANPDNTPYLVREQQSTGGDAVRTIDLERYAQHPLRRRGAAEFDEAASFILYVNEFLTGETRFYASLVEPQALAVLNDDEFNRAGWRDHVAILRMPRTPEWDRWLAYDTRMVPQTEFAEFLEYNLRDITDPDAATLIEIARSFTVSSDVQFRSAHRLSSGETNFAYDEQHEATGGGGSKTVAVPEAFKLNIAPFQGMDKMTVEARLRYRLKAGALTLGYLLDRPLDLERDAFTGIVEQIAGEIERPALYGRPAAPPRDR